jgi:hypothetical protein
MWQGLRACGTVTPSQSRSWWRGTSSKGSRFLFQEFLHPGNTEARYFWAGCYLNIPGSGYNDKIGFDDRFIVKVPEDTIL